MDMDQLRPLVAHPAWPRMEEYLQEQKQGYINRLVAEDDELASMVLRGRIRELDTLLCFPSRVLKKK